MRNHIRPFKVPQVMSSNNFVQVAVINQEANIVTVHFYFTCSLQLVKLQLNV